MDVREKAKNDKRLIDANALDERFDKRIEWLRLDVHDKYSLGLYHGAVTDKDLIGEMPTVDAVEVVHAEWLYDGGSGKYFCSACDADALSFKKDDLYGGDLYEVCLTDYCPSCGAKMDGGVD